jgi:hypothetical protein
LDSAPWEKRRNLARDAACSAGSARMGIDAEPARNLSRGVHRFAAFYNRSPVGNSYTAGVEPSTASFLQTVAWKTVQKYHCRDTTN